jgi:hypothetical protein
MIQFQNWYESTLSSPITAGALNIPISVPPTVTEGLLVLDYDIPALREVIHFTSRDGVSVTAPSSGDTGTSGTGRGYESTTARSHLQNAKVRMVFTAGLAQTIMTGAATIADQNNNKGWVARAETPVYATNNGQKEFTFTVSGDLTAVLDKGMKIKMDRSVAPPTQAMSFAAASSQYATKAAPVGLSGTTAVTFESWVYLNSYAGWFASRSDSATTGWQIRSDNNGVAIQWFGASINRLYATYNALPLRRWTHIAVVATFATNVVNIYFNGVNMQLSTVSAAGTGYAAGTSNLSIGAQSSGGNYLDGYMAETRIWSVAQTQSQIQSNMHINLTGSETNLVGLWRGNGNFNDLTVNANNLTATNGAGFVTMATTPGTAYFNTTEMFIITAKPTYSVPNTTVTVFGGTDFGLPNATMSNFYYSMQRAPFGFPNARGKWMVESRYKTQTNIAGVTAIAQYAGQQLAVPSGEWRLRTFFYMFNVSNASGHTASFGLSTSTSSFTEDDMVCKNTTIVSSVASDANVALEKYITLLAMTNYYMLNQNGNTAVTSGLSSVQAIRIEAESAYI